MTIAKLWRVGVLSVLALSGVACGGVGGDASEQGVGEVSSAVLNGAYAIRFNSNLQCLHDPGNGALGLDGCSYFNDDKWRFSSSGSGFLVQPYFSSPCVQTWNQSKNGMQLRLVSCNTPDITNQERWRMLGRSGLPDGSGYPYFKLQNLQTLRCMTAHRSGSTWQITEETCNLTIDPNNLNDNQILWLDTFNN
jgi:hypothetical protein